MLAEIIDHRKDGSAVSADDAFFVHKTSGRRSHRRTTKGWWLCVRWRDGSTSWEALKDLKESNPLEVAEYAVANKLVHEAAFGWWVPFTIKKRDRIINAVKARVLKKSYMFGVYVPSTVQEALELDKQNGNTLWADAIRKEMKTVSIAFDIKEPGASPPIGYQKIPCHMVFVVKMDGTRKARFVGSGFVCDPPKSITYASVVSRDSVRIAFVLAALNDLDIQSCDVEGAYLQAKSREKLHTICGPEFGPEFEGRTAVIVRALYGTKSAGFSWRSECAQVLRDHLHFESSKADPDVWFRPAVKANGDRYYEYILVYTDDILCLSVKAKEVLQELAGYYKLKNDTIEPPKIYLGGNISKWTDPIDGTESWAMSADKYIESSLCNCEMWLKEHDRPSLKKVKSVFPSGHRPELDVTSELDDDEASYYMSIIGVLRWAMELNRIDEAVKGLILCERACRSKIESQSTD